MKRKLLMISTWILLLVGGTIPTGCGSADALLPEPAPDSGEAVAVSFSLYRYTAEVEEKAGTRVGSTPQDMALGKTFRVYAYPKDATNLASPKATAVYTVTTAATATEPAKATGDLNLYRGAYDLYLVSYNMESETPELIAGTSNIQSGNGKDMMYTTLKNVVVQPNSMGANQLDIQLNNPFTRMGSQVKVKVKGNQNNPVPITSIEKPNYITINGLPLSLTYGLGKPDWDAVSSASSADVYKDSYSFSGFSSTDPDTYTVPWVSVPAVVLPVDGSQLLNFDVNLKVWYAGKTKFVTDSYKASIQKTLLPGMTYEFEFTLTFYGILSPTDLTLAVREYDTVTLSSDGLGKD